MTLTDVIHKPSNISLQKSPNICCNLQTHHKNLESDDVSRQTYDVNSEHPKTPKQYNDSSMNWAVVFVIFSEAVFLR